MVWRSAHAEQGSFAGDKGLAAGRGFTAIRGQLRVGADDLNLPDMQAQRVGGYLRDDGVGTLTDVRCTLMDVQCALRCDANTNGRRVRQTGVAATVPTGCDADATAGLAVDFVHGLRIGRRSVPMLLQRV